MTSTFRGDAGTPQVAILDDDEGMRKSLRDVMEHAGWHPSSFDNCATFIEHVAAEAPNCLIIDLHLPGMNGIEILHAIRVRHGYSPPSIIVTGHGNVPTAVDALRAGAKDFLEKPLCPQLLIDRVRACIVEDLSTRMTQARKSEFLRLLATLSSREREVLDLLMIGRMNKQIASDLVMSHKTVATHRSHILAKLGFESMIQLAPVMKNYL